jgi:hypothetical protein
MTRLAVKWDLRVLTTTLFSLLAALPSLPPSLSVALGCRIEQPIPRDDHRLRFALSSSPRLRSTDGRGGTLHPHQLYSVLLSLYFRFPSPRSCPCFLLYTQAVLMI